MEQDIVDLGVVMGHPQRQLSLQLQIRELTGQILHLQQEIDLFLNGGCTACLVFLYGLAEIGVALAGIVEIGDGLDQLVNVKIMQIHLELTES